MSDELPVIIPDVEKVSDDAILWAQVTVYDSPDGEAFGMFFMHEEDARRSSANIGRNVVKGQSFWTALVRVKVPRSQLVQRFGTYERKESS